MKYQHSNTRLSQYVLELLPIEYSAIIDIFPPRSGSHFDFKFRRCDRAGQYHASVSHELQHL